MRAVLLAAWFAFSLGASELIEAKLETTLVPSPLEYAVLLPEGHAKAAKPYPLLLVLHGGGGDRGMLRSMRATVEAVLPDVVAVTPSVGRSFYMDYRDGSEKWETLLTGPFLEHLRKTYKVAGKPYLFGISMGGMGALRMAFKYPDRYAAVAALEPGIDPALTWSEGFWRSQQLMESIFGKPFDAAYWEANNPATIANNGAERLRVAGLPIYLECGNEDAFGLDEASEFLHQVLWKNGVRHEYHLVHGADHVGRTIEPRSREGLEFLKGVLHPAGPDPAIEALRRKLAPLKRRR
jgi:S-formylglutathione hydrolase